MMAVQCFLQQAVVFAEGGLRDAGRLLSVVWGFSPPVPLGVFLV